MSPTDRCDQVIRLIDEVLDADPAAGGSEPVDVATPETDDAAVEAVPGQWGVYYLKPA